jgi:hypothetical protein
MPVAINYRAAGVAGDLIVLAQSGIPFILAGGTNVLQFTISATGALSNLPTLPITSGNAFFFMPTGITGLTSGWYYGQILSATTAQISTATYTSGDPRLAVPAVFTNPAGITAGNYSQLLSTDIQALSVTMSGGSMGANGSLNAELGASMSNTATSKGFRFRLGSTTMSTTPLANQAAAQFGAISSNLGAQNRNKTVNAGAIFQPFGFTGAGSTYTTVDTSADVSVNFTISIAVATDFVIAEHQRVTVFYGA